MEEESAPLHNRLKFSKGEMALWICLAECGVEWHRQGGLFTVTKIMVDPYLV